jgi:hypothetical protein
LEACDTKGFAQKKKQNKKQKKKKKHTNQTTLKTLVLRVSFQYKEKKKEVELTTVPFERIGTKT